MTSQAKGAPEPQVPCGAGSLPQWLSGRPEAGASSAEGWERRRQQPRGDASLRGEPGGVTMLSCPLLGSLRLCLERRPPLVCFCLCLFSLAAAFLALAAYIQWHEVRDPDITQDWNSLLESLSHLRFCTDNGTWGGPTTLAPTPRAAPPSPGAPPALSVLVGLTFNLPGGGRPNATRLALTVTGHQLGLGGPDAQQPIRLVVVTPWPPGPSPQGSCLSLAGPPSMLPQTRRIAACAASASCWPA
nr:insulin-like growth factor-binding protein 3 receptor isoform X7 [Caretta caretta]